MFKKISHASDKRSIGSELRKEFGWLIEGSEKKAKGLIEQYPKPIYAAMSFILLVSFIIRFTILDGADSKRANQPILQPALNELKKNSVDSLTATSTQSMIQELEIGIADRLAKLHLTREDSLYIVKAEEILIKYYHEKH